VAADQRYCIECGERRGEPRLPFMDGRTAAQPPEPVTAYPVSGQPPAGWTPPPPKNKWTSGLALLSTIGILLLAMGVGVLIGNNGDSKTAAQQPVIIGGGATAAAGPSAATADAAGGDKADAASSDKAGVDADAVAKKNGVKLAPKDVDLGGDCPKGSVGCSDSGEFTGDYFK
jgi:hypothetical protein